METDHPPPNGAGRGPMVTGWIWIDKGFDFMWYFSSPQIVYGEDALSHLHLLEGSRALIVTDANLERLGIAGRIQGILADCGFETRMFADVEPEPSLETVRLGAHAASDFQPDWIIGLGGGSPLDAAKAIWALYERPDLDATEISPLDTLGLHKAKLAAIPTTSGTGSEATWALVLTNLEENRKFTTGSRELVPTVAIVDPSLTMQLPARITADTGLDVLTHAIEGYTSTWHNDFSDGLCLKAVQLVFDYLERAVKDGTEDFEARDKMGIAASIAGLGFGNANAALAHAMGHSFGALFKQPHGRCVALFLPYTMEFTVNANLGRYLDIARYLNLTDGHDEVEAGRLLVDKVRGLERAIEQPMSIKSFGITDKQFQAALPLLVQHAEQDTQYFTAPRVPETEELSRMFEYIFAGTFIDF